VSKNKARLIVAVFTCKKYSERVEAVRSTWGSKISSIHDVFYVYGGAVEDRVEGDRIDLACEESYELLHLKSLRFFQFIHQTFDFDFVIKVDDDTYVDPAFLNEREFVADYTGFIANNENVSREWHYSKVNPELQVPYSGDFEAPYAQGFFYVLSRKAVELLATIDSRDVPEVKLGIAYEDVMVGNVLYRSKQELSYDSMQIRFPKFEVVHPVPAEKMELCQTSAFYRFAIAFRLLGIKMFFPFFAQVNPNRMGNLTPK
jgi:hypothetical protein